MPAGDAGDRDAALRWAAGARSAREDLLDALGTGAETLAGALSRARQDPLIGRIYLLAVLEALPGARKVATRRELDRLGIDHRMPLAEAPHDQILESFGGAS